MFWTGLNRLKRLLNEPIEFDCCVVNPGFTPGRTLETTSAIDRQEPVLVAFSVRFRPGFEGNGRKYDRYRGCQWWVQDKAPFPDEPSAKWLASGAELSDPVLPLSWAMSAGRPLLGWFAGRGLMVPPQLRTKRTAGIFPCLTRRQAAVDALISWYRKRAKAVGF